MQHFAWWDWWQDRKDRYLVTDEPFLDRERFASICVGTGLPEIHQRSTFRFRNVRDGDRLDEALSAGSYQWRRRCNRPFS